MPCAMSDRTTASSPLISGMSDPPRYASLRGVRSTPKQSPLRSHAQVKRDCFAGLILGLAEGETRGLAMTRMADSLCATLIRRDAERPPERREPGVENLCRLAGGLEVEQGAVDEFGEARLVLLQAEAGGARQVVALDQRKILRRFALRRESQEQKLVGEVAVDALLLQRREAGLVVVEEDDLQRRHRVLQVLVDAR